MAENPPKKIDDAILDEEVATKLSITSKEYVKLKRDATAVGLVSLSRKWFETDSEKDD